jgi:Ca2+-transporting ATPase
VALARREGDELSDDPHAYAFELLGLVGLADPVRPAVPAAVRACHEAGIRVVMITGDYPGTALAIARQIGLSPSDACLTGPEVEGLSDAELHEHVRHVSVFARVVPQQKLRLVEAFKADGEVVVMTGDGVNDAPALKAAHIGVAMGGRGTDVAREAAAVVLLDDDFASLVEAVRTGRRILDNLRKAMAYVLAIHVPIAGLALAPVLLGWPLVLLPVHIVFLELIIDPASSVVFEAEPEEADAMHRPPLPPQRPIFGRRRIALSLLQGASILVVVLAVYGVALRLGEREPEARALTFTTLVLANLGLIVVDRSWTRTLLDTLRAPNPALGWVAGGAVVVLGLALGLAPLRGLFRFGVLHPTDLAICAGTALASLLWFEGLKLVRRRRAVRRPVQVSPPELSPGRHG